jgi:hypothetical protein
MYLVCHNVNISCKMVYVKLFQQLQNLITLFK